MEIEKREVRLAWTAAFVSCGILLLAAACSQTPVRTSDPSADPSARATQSGYESAARRALGDESKVLLSGDLARNGHIQLLVVNRLPQTPAKAPGAWLVSRAAILEKENDNWHEIFLADDHLKNEEGFLQGEPVGTVSAWRLQCDRGKPGLAMFFTPLPETANSDSAAIEVRWNPRAGRYQSFDRQSGHFLTEVSNPEGTPSFLIKR